MSKKSKGPLQELGLSRGAEDVYLALANFGGGDISFIARHADQSRADTYRYISELLECDLIRIVTYGKRKHYEAAAPEAIFALLKNKEDRIIDQVENLAHIFDQQKQGFATETFAGKKGISTVYEILVRDAEPHAQLLRIESPEDHTICKKYYPKIYWYRASSRQKGDLDKYVITNTPTSNTRRRAINRSTKAVPDKHAPFSFNFTTVIIEDKVAYIDFQYEKAFLIRNKRFAEYMKTIFWMLYERL